MIGRLNGTLLEKQPPTLLINISGVGYEVEASMNTFYRLPEVGSEIILYTHLIVREDAHLLFGFYDQNERSLFRALIKVNGVGAKLALAILSSLSPDEFVRNIMAKDSASLVRIPGIGKKTAERLIIEMHDRLADWHPSGITMELLDTELLNTPNNKAIQDAISALVALGYKPHEASRAVKNINVENPSREELIRFALKMMVEK